MQYYYVLGALSKFAQDILLIGVRSSRLNKVQAKTTTNNIGAVHGMVTLIDR